MSDVWDFGRPLPWPPGTTIGEPLELAPEVKAELNARLDDMAEARARAAVSAQRYVVWR